MAMAMIEAAVKRARARIVSAAGEGTESDDPASILMRRMIDAFGEYERLIIASRTRAALRAKAARGERTGQIAYGQQLSGRGTLAKRSGMPTGVVVDPDELQAMEIIREMRRGGSTLRAIADHLTALYVPTKNGAPWRHSTVADILKRGHISGQA